MGGSVRFGRAVECTAAAEALASGTEVVRAAEAKGGGRAVELSAAARVSALGTTAAKITAAGGSKGRALVLETESAWSTAVGGSKDSGVRKEAARSAASGL